MLDAGFSDVVQGPSIASSERFEVLVLPGVYAATMYQWKVPTSDVVSVPIGFATGDVSKLRKLTVFLQKVCEVKLHRIFRGSEDDGEERKLKVVDASPTDFIYLNHFLEGGTAAPTQP